MLTVHRVSQAILVGVVRRSHDCTIRELIAQLPSSSDPSRITQTGLQDDSPVLTVQRVSQAILVGALRRSRSSSYTQLQELPKTSGSWLAIAEGTGEADLRFAIADDRIFLPTVVSETPSRLLEVPPHLPSSATKKADYWKLTQKKMNGLRTT